MEGQSTRPPQKAPLAGPTCLHWLCCADSPSAFKDGGCPVPTSLSLHKAALLKVPVGTAQPVGCARSPPVLGGMPRGKPTSSADISTNISTDTHEKRPFGGHSTTLPALMALQRGALHGQGRLQELSAQSRHPSKPQVSCSALTILPEVRLNSMKMCPTTSHAQQLWEPDLSSSLMNSRTALRTCQGRVWL